MSGMDIFYDHHLYKHIPPYCNPADDTLRTISDYWHTCIPSYLALVSTCLGSISIIAWLFAQLPQIYKNFKIRSTAGLSAYFLLIWCLGDTSNLVGAVLTRQATWQVVVAAYYSFVDLTLVGQYIWYELLGHGRKRRIVIRTTTDATGSGGRDGTEREPLLNSHNAVAGEERTTEAGANRKPASNGSKSFKFPALLHSRPEEKDSGESSSNRRMVRTARPTGFKSPSQNAVLVVACLCIALGRASPIVSAPTQQFSSSGDVSVTLSRQEGAELAGRIISWASTFLYLVSRLPQLIKNYKRKSTAGLSASLFAAAFCGNLFYSSSLLTNPLAWADYGPYGHGGWAGPEGSNRSEWVLSATPFFLGAAGVLALDAAVGVQFLVYGEGKKGRQYTPRIPTVVAPVSAPGSEPTQARPSLPRYLAVPPGGSHAEQQDQAQEFEAGSWRRVSGYMRGWVPSFSPGSWSRGGYMASAGRSAREGLVGGPATRNRSASPSSVTSEERNRVGLRAEAEAWESRQSTRQGSIAGDQHDEDRPLLEGEEGRYGSL